LIRKCGGMLWVKRINAKAQRRGDAKQEKNLLIGELVCG